MVTVIISNSSYVKLPYTLKNENFHLGLYKRKPYINLEMDSDRNGNYQLTHWKH